jgi:RNA polymerase sigma-70 factor, ECF subfamily
MVASRSSETSADASSRAPESGTPLVAGARVLEPMDFAELYRAQFSYVWKTARRLGVNAGEVDDVVQETFLTVHRLLDTYEPLGSVQSWLFSLLFRVVQRHRRSLRRRTALTDDGRQRADRPLSPPRSQL